MMGEWRYRRRLCSRQMIFADRGVDGVWYVGLQWSYMLA